MDLKRLLLRLTPKYRMAGDHFVRVQKSRGGSIRGPSGGGSTEFECVDCGEEHRTRDVFSKKCGEGGYNTGGAVYTKKLRMQDRGDGCVWLKVIEGEYKGLGFWLEIYHEEHSEDIIEQLENLEEQGLYQFTLVADNALETAYYCTDIEPISVPQS